MIRRAVAAVLVLVGCAQPAAVYPSDEQGDRDLYECQREARRMTGPPLIDVAPEANTLAGQQLGYGIGARIAQTRMVIQCMKARGYTPVGTEQDTLEQSPSLRPPGAWGWGPPFPALKSEQGSTSHGARTDSDGGNSPHQRTLEGE